MIRKLVASLLINGLMLQPIQQVLEPLYAAEAPVRLASAAAEPKAMPVPEETTVAAEQEKIGEAQVSEASTTEDLGLGVFVGFADNATPSVNFPTPWQGAPNVVYIGGGAPVNAGAIRLDNHSGAPLTIDRVDIDLRSSDGFCHDDRA